MASELVVQRDDTVQLDNGIKNRWNWSWLERKVNFNVKEILPSATWKGSPNQSCNLGEFIRKIKEPGKALCWLCNKIINYASRGVIAMTDHVVTKVHVENYILKLTNFSLPGSSMSPNHQAYGLHPMYASHAIHDQSLPTSSNVPLCDRVSNMEGMVLAFIAEHSLPFSMAEKIVDLASEMSTDSKALSRIKLARTTSSYKMRYGISAAFNQELCKKLQAGFFSLNIDEATSSNLHKILTILVSYYCAERNEIIVEHLDSVNVPTVTSESVFNQLASTFQSKNLSWSNVMAMLMDSCAVMRGSKNGVEVRIRQKLAPNLLDIDGDSCHHVHNATKKFVKPFDQYLEELFRDLYNDLKYSEDMLVIYQNICLLLGLSYRRPEMYVPTRWLTVYDVAVSTSYSFHAYLVFYFGFLPTDDQILYSARLTAIYKSRNVSEASQQEIELLHGALKSKKMTDEGKNRKERIFKKLFYSRKKTRLSLSLYSSALQSMKIYVKTFQQEEPAIFRLHDEQVKVFKEFLVNFLKPEIITKNSSIKKLKKINLALPINHLPNSSVFVGVVGGKILKKCKKNDAIVSDFMEKTITAYSTCAEYLLKKLPLENDFLKTVSAIDPIAIQSKHAVVLNSLLHLPDLVHNVLSDEEEASYTVEARRIMVDSALPQAIDFEGKRTRADKWWGNVSKTYPSLSKMSLALLTIFHGPRVESSFSVMSDVIDKKSGRMNVETYSAIQNVKYHLNATSTASSSSKAIEMFKRTDKLTSPVLMNVVRSIRTSKNSYESNRKANLAMDKAKKRKLDLAPQPTITRKRMQLMSAEEEQSARNLQPENSSNSTIVVESPVFHTELQSLSQTTAKKSKVQSSLNHFFKNK